MSDPTPPRGEFVVRLFGAMLMAIGGLVAVASGLCSLAVLAASFQGAPSPNLSGLVFGSLLVLGFGGIPFAVGAGLFVVGRHLCRRR